MVSIHAWIIIAAEAAGPAPGPNVSCRFVRVRRAHIGPGLWPGPRRQARWAGRGLQRSRVGPEDRFCEAVFRNDLRVPLTLEGPARTMRGVPARRCDLSYGDWRTWRVTTDPAARGAHDPRRVTAGCAAARCGASARRAAARDRCAPAQEGAGQAAPPPAARVPNTLRRTVASLPPARSRSPCTSRASSRVTAWAGRLGAPEVRP